MLGLQTDFRPPCDYSDAGWRFYTSSNERKKKRKEKEESVEKKQEKIRIYIYIEQDKRERGPRLASGTYPRSKSVGYPFWFTSSTTASSSTSRVPKAITTASRESRVTYFYICCYLRQGARGREFVRQVGKCWWPDRDTARRRNDARAGGCFPPPPPPPPLFVEGTNISLPGLVGKMI